MRGCIVLASDATRLYANMNDKGPFLIVLNVGPMLDGYRRLRDLAEAPQLVVPGTTPL